MISLRPGEMASPRASVDVSLVAAGPRPGATEAVVQSLHEVVAFARDAYAQGRGRADVLAAVYGVELPAELFAVLAAWQAEDILTPVDPLDRLTEAWLLAGPSREPWLGGDERQQLEADAAARYPDVVLLLELTLFDAEHGGYLVGYDRHELAAGRTTVVGFDRRIPADGSPPDVLGPCLVQVLREMATDHLRMIRAQRQRWENMRYGYVDEDDERNAAAVLALVEGLS